MRHNNYFQRVPTKILIIIFNNDIVSTLMLMLMRYIVATMHGYLGVLRVNYEHAAVRSVPSQKTMEIIRG